MKTLVKTIIFIIIICIIIFGAFLAYSTITDYQPTTENLVYKNDVDIQYLISKRYNLLIWNIGYAGLSEDMDFFYDGGEMVKPSKKVLFENFENIKTFIQSQKNIGFFLLQEVDINSNRSYGLNQYEAMSKIFPNYHSSFGKNYDVNFIPVPVEDPLGEVNSGLQTLSKYEPKKVIRYSFPGNYSWPQGMFMPDRCFLVNYYPLPNNKELIVVNTHNSAYDDGSLRDGQMDHINKFLEKEYQKGNYIIVGGDWNQCPPNFAADFDKDIMDTKDRMDIENDVMPGWKWVYQNKVPTNRHLETAYERGKTITSVIDFYLVSPNVEIIEVKGIDLEFENSDHQPVELVIELN